MAKTLNFNNLKKQYMTVTLPDEKKTTLMVGTPTKKIMDEFISMGSELENAGNDEEAMGELYALTAKIMSRNKGGITVTAEQLEESLDFEDIIVFIKAYTEFISEVSGRKN